MNPELKNHAEERFFLVKEPHCKGFAEDREWALQDWVSHEGLIPYNQMNDEWLRIVTSAKSLMMKSATQQSMQMFFMVSYNLDRFREFIFHSPFLKRFELTPQFQDQLRSNDEVLLRFGMDWLRFILFGEPTVELK